MKKINFFEMGKIIIISLFCWAIPLSSCYSREVKRPDSYNFQRALEALGNQNTEEAAEYLTKELEEYPKNGFAHYWMGCISYNNNEYGSALSSANKALKFIPKQDKEYLGCIYSLLSDIYAGLDDKQKALDNITLAINTTPDENEYYGTRGQMYFEDGKYDLSNRDYQKMIELDEGSVVGYMGLGRNDMFQEKYEHALERFSYVTKLSAGYSSAYSFRSEVYLRVGKLNESINDAIHALKIDSDTKAFYMLGSIADSSLVLVKNKLELMSKKEPSNAYWPFCLGYVLSSKNADKEAIPYFVKSYELDANPIISFRLAYCHYNLCNYRKSLEYINNCIEQDSVDTDYKELRANVYYELGENKKALADMDACIELNPDNYSLYADRAFYKAHLRDYQGALDDLDLSLLQNPNQPLSYLYRGDMHKKLNQMDKAMADYAKVVELDSLSITNFSLCFALLELGKEKEAYERLDKMLEKNDFNGSQLYNTACFYSRANAKQKALYYLEESFKQGEYSFSHVENDYDLDNIRNTSEFKALVEKYRSKYNQSVKKSVEPDLYEQVSVVPFVKESGVTKVKCSINDLPLFLVFDTGAANVSLSNVEAAFMFKNGYLNKSDVIGSQNYMNADGSITTGTTINLKEVEFGDIKLQNINASIVNNQQAPLLLGQSVLTKLGKIEIDNKKQILKITQRKLKK